MQIGRSHRAHPMMWGGAPATMASGHITARAASPASNFPYRYPLRAELSPLQADLLELIRVGPRDMKEAAEALGIGEWSKARHALDQLVRRELAEEIHGYPTTWRAL